MKKSSLSVLIALGLILPVFTAEVVQQSSNPRLVPDYNRDGVINTLDYDREAAGEPFTVWLNDDDDAEGTDCGAEPGDTNTDLHDVPGGEGNDRDCEDDKVNGRCDLLDFFPVLVDVGRYAQDQSVTWKIRSASVNAVFIGLDAEAAGSFHTTAMNAFGGETPLYEAPVMRLDEDDVKLPPGFLKDGRGVLIVEGASLGDGGITLLGETDGSDPMEVTLNLRVKNVEDMYGWMNLRPKAGEVERRGGGGQWNDTRHFVLVHGYNTNHEEARGNAAEFYKKLWQSGSDAMFTAVEWRGDQSQMQFDLLGVTFSPNYFANVENAFAAARPFADACKKLPGEKILVGHSLGNMLISSAIKDYGLDYTKYVMLNAAVAREAYDESAYDPDMVSVLWTAADEVRGEGVGEGVGGGEGEGGGGDIGGDSLTNHLDRASRWYRNFADHRYDPYEYRRKLAWRGRFANLPRTVNYYSPTDNLLRNPAASDPDDLDVDDAKDNTKVEDLLGRTISLGGFWSLSEKLKGRPILIETINGVLTNIFGMAESEAYKCEGGWGENDDYEEDRPFDPANTRFTPFLDERLKTSGMLDILPAETERLRAQHLADAIPAESFAAGANPVATLENVNEESFIGENPDWPVGEVVEEIGGGGQRKNEWKHSTFREVAFYHTSKLYASLAATGKPRVIIDTDLGSSMDDLFTIDLAARMHREGKLDLMAVMMDRPDGCNPTDDPYGKGEFLTFADRYLASLGLRDLPIGTSESLPNDQTVFNPYWTLIYSNNLTGVGLLLPTNRTPEQIATLPNAVSLYRRLLADAPDKSVVICSTGFLTNLKALMESAEDYEKDGSINTTGMNLIRAKVKELRIMAGCFDYSAAPIGGDGAEYNAAGDPAAAKKVFEGWPSPVVVSPWEVGLKLDYKPEDVLKDFPAGAFDSAVRATYAYWSEPGPDVMNRLWDVMTVLPLTEGETLVPLSEMGGVSVDETTGKTTFTPNASSNRCYQVASNMNVTAVMDRFRAICRTGNPSVSVVPISPAEPGVDYNGSTLSVELDGANLGRYSIGDLRASLTVEGETYGPDPDSIRYDELGGVLKFTITVPPDRVTAGNEYDGEVRVSLKNDILGENVLYTRTRKLVQGRAVRDENPTDWFYETDLEAPTNYVPATAMPERCLATVDTTVGFDGQDFVVEYQTATNAVQGAVRIVEDGAGGYKFQYYACVGKTNEDSFVRGWWDFNVGGEDVSEIKPVPGEEYTVRAEAYYFEDARGEENTLVISVEEVDSNRGMVKQFIGNIINEKGGQGGTTRLNSVGLADEGTASLVGNYCTNGVNANLAKIDGVGEYAMVTAAVAAVWDGQAVRLLHAASWKPTVADLGNPVKFLNKSWLNLDLSGLPSNALPVWTDVDGNDGTLTLELVTADTVVYGTIRTAEEGNPVAEALAVADGKYVYVGDEAGVAAFIEDGVTKVVDHRGKGMVMPGCTDGHSHYTMQFGLANMKGGILFDMADDKTAVLKKVEAAARIAQAAGKTCLFGFGWSIVALRVEDPPTLKELDDASEGVSMVIFAQGGHHAYCNSECLKRCGIIDGEGKVLIKEIPGGFLELDENGYPTGFADERVTGYLMRMGGINYDEIVDDEVAEASIRASQELLLSTGYTIALEGWSNILHPSNFYAAAHRMDTNGILKLVFPMTYEVEPWQTNMTSEIDYLDSLNKTYATEHVRPEYLKVFMDGCVESMTGAMIKPYKDQTVYKSFWPVNRLADITRSCNAKGLTVHTHVMGDAAIKETTDAYIQGGDGTHRNCMVHLRHVRKEDYQRFADNNIACSAGFTWHVSSKEMDDLLENFLDEDYIKHAYPMKSFFDAGVKVSSHSDFPANAPSPQDPFGTMQVALTGLLPNPAEGDKPFDTDELVTIEQVFRALTINGAWQLGLENERGSIAVGKWADFVLADQDVFECEKTKIGKTKVVSTWFEGEMVYQVQGSKGNPWEVGATEDDAVIAYMNGTGRLVIDGWGEMMDFDGDAPWSGENVTEVVVGEGVESIGANALAPCTGLRTLVLYSEEPPELGEGNGLSGVKIFVPTGTADDYRMAWLEFADGIAEMRSEEREIVPQRLYEVSYRWWDATMANDVAETLALALAGELEAAAGEYFLPYEFFDWYEDSAANALCTSCRNGNFIGRNFDWAYDDVEECVMRVPAAEGRFASVGVASRFFPELLQVLFGVEEFLPELTMDGINEKGVAINVNVVPAGDNGETTGTNPGAKRLCAGFAVRAVLDSATNAAHAVKILQSRDIFSIRGLEFHWMISDADESYIVECAENELVVLRAKDARPKMANFYVSHSPNVAEYDIVSDNEHLTSAEHTPHAMGIERYARVSNGLDRVESVAAMFTQMTNVWYKLKYLPGNEERYWSDLNGQPVPGGEKGQRFTAFDGPELAEVRSNAFKSLQANYVAVTNYEAQNGSRTILFDETLTNQVVHTVHTSIYDLERRELTVCVQEDAGRILAFSLVGAVPGSEQFPWKVGTEGHETEVTAWTNGTGKLVVEGAGAVGSMPWAEFAYSITELVKAKGVTGLEELVGSLPDLTTVNGLTREDFGSAILGFVKADGFSAIEVKNGEAKLDVVVGRSDSLGASAEWKPVSTNTVEVLAPGEQGFFIVAPLTPSDR